MSKEQRRWLSAIVAVLCIAGITMFGLWVRVAMASDPTGCTWPGSSDNFEAVSAGNRLTSTLYNKLQCAVNALEDAVDAVDEEVRSACTSVSVSPGERKLIGVPLSGAALVGTEPVFTSVQDDTTPARLEVSGIQELTSTQAKVWIFNHDPDSTRTGTACALVVP